MLALADRRTDEQIQADAEIDLTTADERDELVRYWQDAVGACGTFLDHWYQRNNLPSPPNPATYAMEMMGVDLVAEASLHTVSREVVTARFQKRSRVRVLAAEIQLPLL